MTPEHPHRLLMFGGTGESRLLGETLTGLGYEVITSLAGVTEAPLPVAGQVLRGSLGGAAGIAALVREQGIAAIIDASHPFAARISQNASDAAKTCAIPYLCLVRPAWVPEPGDRWAECRSSEEISRQIPEDARLFLTLGGREAAAFLNRPDLAGVVRMIEAPRFEIPPGWRLLRERPPFTVAHELEVIDSHRLGILVSRNSGGEQTRAKLIAARARGLPVFMLARPAKPEPNYANPQQLISELTSTLRS